MKRKAAIPKPAWKPYWSVLIQDAHEYEVVVCADGSWEIANIDLAGDVQQKGQADTPEQARAQALGAFAKLADWIELAEWEEGEYLVMIRPGRFGHEGLYECSTRRRFSSGKVESRRRGADSLEEAKANCEADMAELRCLPAG